MKRVLITGARGFIGRHCLRPAVEAGYDVHATINSGEPPGEVADLPIRWHRTDLLSSDGSVIVAAVRPTHILHFAWETSHGAYWTSPANLAWLAAGSRLAEAFARHGGERFVVGGTCAEYGWTDAPLDDETSVETPATFYGRMKLLHHRMLMAASDQFEFSAATGRIYFAYGPHENAGRLIPSACVSLAAGRDANFTSGVQRRDFLHVRDTAAGFLALLDSNLNGACNIASGVAVSTAEIVTALGTIAGRPDLIHLGALPDRPGDPALIVGTNARLASTGWRPQVTLEAGLRETYEWWAEKHT